MANWSILKTAIADVIRTNGNQEITGQVLQSALNSMINALGEYPDFAGVATPTTAPGVFDGPVFFLASTPGNYPNFSNITLNSGELVILRYSKNTWVKEVLLEAASMESVEALIEALRLAFEAQLEEVRSSAPIVDSVEQGTVDIRLQGISRDFTVVYLKDMGTFAAKVGSLYYSAWPSWGPYAPNGSYTLTSGRAYTIGGKLHVWNGTEMLGMSTPIINDLTTGGADKALSAEMGKKLNNDVFLTNAKIGILIYPYVDRKLNIYYDSLNRGLVVDFTGFNVKFRNRSYEKTKAVVISEVGQSGENLVIPEGKGLAFNTTSYSFEVINTYSPGVIETKILILSHHNNGYLNYIHPCLSEYVYTNKISAVRKEVNDLQEVVATYDKAIETLDKRLISDVELGTISDSNGQDLERTNRMRTIGYLNRENYRGFTIRGTSAIHIWTLFYDKNFNFISTRPDEGWWWATNYTDNEIDTLPEDIAYLRLVFRKSDDSDITEEDVAKIQDVLSTIYPERRVTQLGNQLTIYGANIFANISPNNVYIKGNSVFFKPNGFGISLKRNVYWIADASRTKTEDYVYTFSSAQDLLVIDTSALSKVGSRNELSDVIKIIQIYGSNIGYDYTRYIPLFYYHNKIFPLGECKDIFFPEFESKSDGELTHEYINNEILFSPEFYAYAQGRYNDNNGVGTGWYKRFSLLHISDTHQYNALVKESLSVGNAKVAAIINTGDDANGGSPEIIKNELNATASTITSNCSIPYIGCNGNHDVPEITKKEYWDIMCSVINDKTSVVWGDADGYRTYGYADFTSDEYEGDYRIIMLDPFDYDDGMYGVTYTWQSAVFSQKQIDWLIESLLDAANKGYHVLTAMHYSFGDNTLQFNDDLAKPDAKFYQDAFMIPDIIDAIQNKLVLNRNYLDEKGVNNITINKDFTDVADLSYVAHLFGHIHSKNEYRCQKTDGSKKYDILMLGEATLGTYGNALNKAYKKSGTINEIAFSALAVDPIEKCIYRVSYGSYLNYDKSNSERTVKIPYRYSAE